MRKLTTIVALVSAIMIGCGGGGGSTSSDDTQQGTTQGTQNGTFAYPEAFRSFENLKHAAYDLAPVEHDVDFLALPLQILGVFKADLMRTTLITENPDKFKRAECEKGSATGQGLTYSNEPFEYATFAGGFTYHNSYGVQLAQIGLAEEACSDSYFRDGIISFDHNDEDHINATLDPLILDHTGFVGSFQHETNNGIDLLTSKRMEIFKIPDQDQEAYISTGKYTKMEDVTYSNVRFENKSDPDGYTKATYTLSWREDNIPFILDIEKSLDANTQTYRYHLHEDGNPAHFVKVSMDVVMSQDGIQSITTTYNKEGYVESATN